MNRDWCMIPNEYALKKSWLIAESFPATMEREPRSSRELSTRLIEVMSPRGVHTWMGTHDGSISLNAIMANARSIQHWESYR